MPARSPLARAADPLLPPLAGVRLAAVQAGVRYRNRTDVCLIELAAGTRVAGVFTRSLTAAAPVELCRAHLAGYKKPRYFRFVNDLPKSGYGKILKRELKARIVAETKEPAA